MRVSEINIYPIKSLGGISLEKSVVEKRGLRFDRRFMLIDADNRFVSQREFPRLAALTLSIDDEFFKVAAPDGEVLRVPSILRGDRKQVTVWNSICDAVIAGRHINRWFSDQLGHNFELAYMPEDSLRPVNKKFNKGKEIVSFADGYPLLMIGQSSLDELNSKMEVSVPMNRFRPNIVLEGSEPFDEDKWKAVKIGENVFRSTKPCARCVITTIDQSTGTSAGSEPLRSLAKFRSASHVFPENYESFGFSANSVLFGQNFVPEKFGSGIKVGDTFTTIEN